MKQNNDLYEPVLNFRKNKPKIQIEAARHSDLYEEAFFSKDEKSQSEYALNTATWD